MPIDLYAKNQTPLQQQRVIKTIVLLEDLKKQLKAYCKWVDPAKEDFTASSKSAESLLAKFNESTPSKRAFSIDDNYFVNFGTWLRNARELCTVANADRKYIAILDAALKAYREIGTETWKSLEEGLPNSAEAKLDVIARGQRTR